MGKNAVTTIDEKIFYPIVNGIIDFVSDGQYVPDTYDSVSSYYDTGLTNSTFLTKLYNKVVWGIHDIEYANNVLSLFPKEGRRIILDVPVGTGVFTVDLYKELAKTSSIIALDYSMGMLKKAKERYEKSGLNDVLYIRGDVAQLPIMSEVVNVLLTMNGYHAFPDKDNALKEIARVVKPNGCVLGCFYIKGEKRITDFVVNTIYKRQGTFSPPFYSKREIKNLWGTFFDFQTFGNLNSILYFKGVKIAIR
ncbi:MAG: class I SAM-dependent methyltransferase [Candidatus Bathyarchaeota archaeon]|nr:class I SAM-dependent methyltransferase [Candidatus Bathyarchaeota archaeon]